MIVLPMAYLPHMLLERLVALEAKRHGSPTLFMVPMKPSDMYPQPRCMHWRRPCSSMCSTWWCLATRFYLGPTIEIHAGPSASMYLQANILIIVAMTRIDSSMTLQSCSL